MRLDEVVLRTTRAAQPVATAVPPGTLAFITDEGKLERSTGNAWEPFAPQTLYGTLPPASSVPAGTLTFYNNGHFRCDGATWQQWNVPITTIIRRGTRAAQTAGPPGGLYYVTDEGKLERRNDAATAWEEFGWTPDRGTFTPELYLGGVVSPGITYSTGHTRGEWLALGPWVFVQFGLVLTNKGSGTGQATIRGIPFTDQSWYWNPVQIIGGPLAGVTTPLAGALERTTAVVNLAFGGGGLSSGSNLTASHLTNTTELWGSTMFLRSATVPW